MYQCASEYTTAITPVHNVMRRSDSAVLTNWNSGSEQIISETR